MSFATDKPGNFDIMLVGLPGSGKSTLTNNLKGYAIISSDSARERLYGSEEIQGNWDEVWQEICRQIINAKRLGLPVVYDACNICSEHRASILSTFKGPWTAFVFVDDPWECWKRNCRRERVVPGYAFNGLVSMWEYPRLDEGFIAIQEVNNFANK